MSRGTKRSRRSSGSVRFRIIPLLFILVALALAAGDAALPSRRALAGTAPGGQFTVDYLVRLTEDDKPDIEVSVAGAPSGSTVLTFGVMGGPLGAIRDLSGVFSVSGVTAEGGAPVAWRWADNVLTVENGSSARFTLKYKIDAARLAQGGSGGGTGQRFAIFRKDILFFIPGDVFPLPLGDPARSDLSASQAGPSEITVRVDAPKGMSVHSTLREVDGIHHAVRDLWGNLVYDFQKATFMGGATVMTASHTTAWGDQYLYLRFGPDIDHPVSGNMADPSVAKRYMAETEKMATYFRDAIGPLPTHTVLFGNDLSVDDGATDIAREVDWFHFMQVWPIDGAMPEIAHHLFHAYSFWPAQSKLSYEGGVIDRMLSEGLGTYFEQTVPSHLYGEDKYRGKLFEFYALEQRGQPLGISQNAMHQKYNVAALRVYLLDRFIRETTGGHADVTSFARAMWDMAKDFSEPRQLSEEQVVAAFASVVGAEKASYVREVASGAEFRADDFRPLVPAFKEYVGWLAGRFFAGNQARFLVFLDIAAGKGAEWPHYATYPHQLEFRASEGLRDFDAYIERLGKPLPDKADILAALGAATGKEHKGFFEFWEQWGFELEPKDLMVQEAAPVTAAPQDTPGTQRSGSNLLVPVLAMAVAGGLIFLFAASRKRAKKTPE